MIGWFGDGFAEESGLDALAGGGDGGGDLFGGAAARRSVVRGFGVEEFGGVFPVQRASRGDWPFLKRLSSANGGHGRLELHQRHVSAPSMGEVVV